MIGLDTNVVVRYIMRDDPEQTALADAVMSGLTAREPGYLSLVVLVELWWVLGRSYRRSTAERERLFAELVRTDELKIESHAIVESALGRVAEGADFADALISEVGAQAGCRTCVTFDEMAAKNTGMTGVEDWIARTPELRR